MRRAGFTLVELMLVLAILAMMVAFVAPSLARTSRRRILEGEALRFVALTEYGRDEAVSLGVPVAVYLDTKAQVYGVEPATDGSGANLHKEYTANSELHFEQIRDMGSVKDGRVISFTAEGALDTTSVPSVTLSDRSGDSILIARQSSGWGYEMVKEGSK